MDKDRLLKELTRRVINCRKCKLWLSRTNAVPGSGNYTTGIMLIGEAPGRQEDLEGKPFVGAAGKLLNEVLKEVGSGRSFVYITNLVKCRPPGNRDPQVDEIEACSPYLEEELKIIDPKVIVTLGNHSTRYLLRKIGRKVQGVLKVRGKVYKLGDAIIVPTIHPAAALYNPRLRGLLVSDLKLALSYVKLRSEGLDEYLS
ncbi:MAG: uracil-DNA glycosylase [Thermofilum sp. ex4484_15]|nr:MAG: uracil-DNA glycosylase [Thermofilum sp. ex4484_15]